MKKNKIHFLKEYGVFGALPRLCQSAHCRIRVFVPLRLCVINQPKSTLPCKKANQKPADANQKKKLPLDSGCEETALRAETCNFLRPAPTYCNLFQPIYAPLPPFRSRLPRRSAAKTGPRISWPLTNHTGLYRPKNRDRRQTRVLCPPCGGWMSRPIWPAFPNPRNPRFHLSILKFPPFPPS
jgi:hypothetical protein